MKFDASVDITDAMVPPSSGVPDTATLIRVRAAVAALPGAGWVSVERCAGTPDGLPWLSVYGAGSARPLGDKDDGAVRTRITDVVRSALP